MEGSLPQTLSLSSVLMLDFILGIWMIRGTLKYIYIYNPYSWKKSLYSGVAREQCVWCLHLGWDLPWERTLMAFCFFLDPEAAPSLKLNCGRAQLCLCDTGMCLLLRVSRTAHLNNDSEPGSHPSPAASVQIPPVHYKGFKGFMQDYRRGSCSRNLPWCHINPLRTPPSWLPVLCLGQMSLLLETPYNISANNI